jgi:GNAT superfamily N-acetyltransferase
MEINVARESQLLEVLYILRQCSQQLIDKGVRYWYNPTADSPYIADDIKHGYVYICSLNRVSIGTITIKKNLNEPTISEIERLAIYPHYQGKGYAKQMIDFAVEHSKANGFKIIRGTIPVDDKSLCKLLEERGFTNLGVALNVPNELVKIVFEKILV